MFIRRGLSEIQKVILSEISKGATIDDILFAVYQGENEPEYAYNSIRTIIGRLRKYGYKISNRPSGFHSGKTGRGTKAFYRLVS